MHRTDEVAQVVDDRGAAPDAPWSSRILAAPVAVRWLLALVLLAGVAALNVLAGAEISFSIFYLVPVSFAGAFISRLAGLLLAVVCAATWGYIDVSTGPAYSAAWIPFWNSAVRLGFFVLVNELIERLRRAHDRQRTLAREDSLTGLANSRVFEENAQRVIATSRRSGHAFTLAYVDLDGFKKVNDRFGHFEGDRLLRTIAVLLVDGARSTDLVARLGGDEFAILMPDTQQDEAQAALQRIAHTIADGVGEHWEVDVTVGAVTFTEPPEDVGRAVREADAVMYRGKAQGRGRILQVAWP